MYVFEPKLARFRLEEGKTPTIGLFPPQPGSPSVSFEALAKRVLVGAPTITTNVSLDILFSDGDPDSVTYDNYMSFDNHGEYLFHLAFNQ